jgi:two-component system sensor histidine kinase BaeS
MRIRLVHTLSLLLLTAVLLAVSAMGGLMAWNLRNGFSDYLAARDTERIDRFAEFLAEKVVQAGGIRALQDSGLGGRELLDEFAGRQGWRPDKLPPQGARQGTPTSPGEHPPPHGGPDGLGERGGIFGLDGELLWGRPLPDDAGPLIERPVLIKGQTVALLRLLKPIPVPDDVDARFLVAQYTGIVGVAVALLLLALAGAWWVASRWVRPLLAVQEAAGRIARGEFGYRLSNLRSDEIGDVMRNVNEMAQGLAQLESARRRWIADMSHELRTPLAALRGEIEALVDGVRPLTAEAALSLREEVLHLGSLVDDLHLLAMSDLNALPCHFEETDAMGIVQRVWQRFALRAQQSGLTLELEDDPTGPIPVCWDARRIEQLLGNLVDNSLRYTDAPGRTSLRLAVDSRRVCIEVDDTAPGVLAPDLEKVFEPLYRADAARSRHSGGSGLGLAICRAIVTAHRGAISATASPLGGLRIRIELPAAPTSN